MQRAPVPAVLSYLRSTVQHAAPADYTDKDVMLRYIAIIEQLVPDKVQDDEIQFALDYLHLNEGE